jgi:hypothetical protein
MAKFPFPAAPEHVVTSALPKFMSFGSSLVACQYLPWTVIFMNIFSISKSPCSAAKLQTSPSHMYGHPCSWAYINISNSPFISAWVHVHCFIPWTSMFMRILQYLQMSIFCSIPVCLCIPWTPMFMSINLSTPPNFPIQQHYSTHYHPMGNHVHKPGLPNDNFQQHFSCSLSQGQSFKYISCS